MQEQLQVGLDQQAPQFQSIFMEDNAMVVNQKGFQAIPMDVQKQLMQYNQSIKNNTFQQQSKQELKQQKPQKPQQEKPQKPQQTQQTQQPQQTQPAKKEDKALNKALLLKKKAQGIVVANRMIKNDDLDQKPQKLSNNDSKISNTESKVSVEIPTQPQIKKTDQQKRVEQVYHNVEPILKKIKEKFKVATPLHLLIGDACGKLIQTHSDALIELVIDDILLETVEILNKIEDINDKKKAQERNQIMINDLVDDFKDYFNLQQQMRQDIQKRDEKEQQFQNIDYQFKEKTILLDIDREKANQIRNGRGKIKFTEKNINKYVQAVDKIVDNLFDSVYKELDGIQAQYISELFSQEFFQ